MRRWLFPMLVVLLLTGCVEQGPDGAVPGLGLVQEWKHPSTPAVTFRGTTVEGKPFDLASNRGRVSVVNFWYSGCNPCRREAPILKSLAAEFAADGVRFVGVNTRDISATAAGFERTFAPGYPSVVDQKNSSSAQLAFAGARGPNMTPATLVLDRRGRVTARFSGLVDEQVLRSLIRDAVDRSAT